MPCQVNRYRGTCAACGRKVAPGKGAVEKILGAWTCYCAACGAPSSLQDATVGGPVWKRAAGAAAAADVPYHHRPSSFPAPRRVSDVVTTSGGTFYRNKRGLCEDAPCCGCCTI
jgi:hypothetical protein